MPAHFKSSLQVLYELWDNMVKIISEKLGTHPDEITRKARFINDLGADSLDIVELVMAFEEEYNIDIPDGDADRLFKVGDAYEYGLKRLE